MRLEGFSLRPYRIPLRNGTLRSGVLICVADGEGNEGWGDVAPLPKWSPETLEAALETLTSSQHAITHTDWVLFHCLQQLQQLRLSPSASFGLESALLSLLDPLSEHEVATSALLMGSPSEVMEQAELRGREGYTSAKLKVGHLPFQEAARLIHQLRDKFRLRIDVNRAWRTADSLRFFEPFALDAFDYVEEPFQDPRDLGQFRHPFAIDESFPHDLSLQQLETLPALKALIVKPTIQGGLSGCLALRGWAKDRGVTLVLSSSFESDIGLAHIASMAHRLKLSAPVGIGTYHQLTEYLCANTLRFSRSWVTVPNRVSYTHSS